MNHSETPRRSLVPQVMRFGLLGVSALIMTGCLSQNSKPAESALTPDQIIQAPMDNLERVALEIRDETKRLADMRQADREAAMTREDRVKRGMAAADVPVGFDVKIKALNVTDDLESVMQLIGIQTGYAVKVTNPQWRHDYPIALRMKDQALYDALLTIGVQTDDAVMINVFPVSKTIVIEYKERV